MSLKIALAQTNFTVGAITENTNKICALAHQAYTEHQADVIIFPELALTGYPPGDLLFQQDFLVSVSEALQEICRSELALHIIVGHPQLIAGKLFNAASVIFAGKILVTYQKQELPNYEVFTEKRYFESGDKACVININNISCGILICEDVWCSEPATQAKQAGAEILLVLNASPFANEHRFKRLSVLQQRVAETSLPIAYVNLLGGQDELVFDGGSLLLQANGTIANQPVYFQEQLLLTELVKQSNGVTAFTACKPQATLFTNLVGDNDSIALIYQALVISLQDYLRKNKFSHAVIGLSGGIDSALTLAIACDAVGPQNIHAVMLPSAYTAEISLQGARAEADILKVKYSVINIETIYHEFLDLLQLHFSGLAVDVTEENLQARCRGVLLMALANKTNAILLNTSNKSELAVGYGTLYGDMAGGFAVLKDVLKTQVYQLAHYRNRIAAVIPLEVINRAPSAELAPDQTDQDSLPAYDILDAILKFYIEDNFNIKKIVAQGFEPELVQKVLKMVQRNEYKRQQTPPGTRISRRAFGLDWQMPITSGKIIE